MKANILSSLLTCLHEVILAKQHVTKFEFILAIEVGYSQLDYIGFMFNLDGEMPSIACWIVVL